MDTCEPEQKMCEMAPFKEAIITETAGLATVYANDGGIIVTL